MKKLIDISLTISPRLVVWPGDPAVHMERTMQIADGDSANVTSLRFGAHIGTHMDAPLHFINDGRSIDEIMLDELIGKVQVLEIPPDATHITRAVLETLAFVPEIDKILFKTKNSDLWRENHAQFDPGYVGLSPDGAQYLIEKGIRLIGIDYLSAAAYDSLTETHQLLLGQDILLLEGLDLTWTLPGVYLLLCLPLKLQGADGAPMRAALAALDYFS